MSRRFCSWPRCCTRGASSSVVTYVNSEYNHRRLLRSRGAGSLAGLDDFRFETIPDGLPPSDGNDDVTQDIPALCDSLSRNGAAPFRDLLARLNTTPGRPPVTCVVLDNFMSFAQRVANEMGIPAVVFCTMSACGFMGYLHYKELMDRGYVPLKDESCLSNGYLDTVLDWVPGMPGIRLRDIPSFIRTTDPDDFMVHFDSGEAQNARRAQGIIVNTFDALEQDVVDALRRIFPRVYTIGPLLTFVKTMARPDAAAICGNLWKEDASCLRWLDARGPGSVVYVNFGSITVMTPAQLAECPAALWQWQIAVAGRPAWHRMCLASDGSGSLNLPLDRPCLSGGLLHVYASGEAHAHPARAICNLTLLRGNCVARPLWFGSYRTALMARHVCCLLRCRGVRMGSQRGWGCVCPACSWRFGGGGS